MSDRYYLTSDDIRQQQRINRAVAELVDPAPVVNRRRNLLGDSGGSVEKIMFRCVYSRTDGDGNEGNYIHVFDETYDGEQQGHKRAGLAILPTQNRGEWVNEAWLPIPEELESGYVYLNRIYTFSPVSYKFELKIANGEYVYYNEAFRQSTMVASLTKVESEEEEQPSYYEVTQILYRNDDNAVRFDSITFSNSALYPEMSDLYTAESDPDYTAQKVIIRSTWETLRPLYEITGSWNARSLRYPVTDLNRNLEIAVNPSTGEIPVKSIMYWCDQNYRLTGELADGFFYAVSGEFAYYQTNFRGRNFVSGVSTYNPGYHRPAYSAPVIGRPKFDWEEFPVYSQFQVDFTFTRERIDPDEYSIYLKVRDTATGIHVFNPSDPDSQYAGYVQYSTWRAPAATLPLTAGTLYLTCTWDTENSAPVFAYTFDISQIDEETTWVKMLAEISGTGEYNAPWRITQNTDRDFNIYGRWV